jgi:hypothetical protein
MKAAFVIALLVITLPAAAQAPLPPGSYIYDANPSRIDLRAFAPPTPVKIGPGPRQELSERPLPPDAIRNDDRRIELRPFGAPRPEPKPKPKPEKGVG